MENIWLNQALVATGIFGLSFLIGSIPWGVIVTRAVYHKDIRSFGSGNIGATNAYRTFGSACGAVVFLLDFLKGLSAAGIASVLVPVLLAGTSTSPYTLDFIASFSFLGSLWGHVFCPWLHFKGGKGVATSIGCLFVIIGLSGALCELVVFVIVVAITRYVSAGSISAAVACPVFAIIFVANNPAVWAVCTICALTVIWAHRQNISRLRTGTENRLSRSASH